MQPKIIPANDNDTNDAPLPPTIATLVDGDCHDLIKEIGDGVIDLVVLDLPYAVQGRKRTALAWDKPFDLNRLWIELRRILSPTGTVIAFGTQPFTSDLVNSARDLFKYSLVWQKNRATQFVLAKRRPLCQHEDILVFSNGVIPNRPGIDPSRLMTYNPLGAVSDGLKRHRNRTTQYINIRGAKAASGEAYESTTNYPRTILEFAKDGKQYHSTQKPVALLEYLIRMFSNPGDIVFDPTVGSGSTGVAAVQSGRHFLGFELDSSSFAIAERRIAQAESDTIAANDNQADARPKYEVQQPPKSPPLVIGDATIHHDDCLNAMRSMADGSIDLICTSPPYNVLTTAGGGMNLARKGAGLWSNAPLASGYAEHGDNMPHDEYVEWQRDCLREMWRLIPDDGAIFYNHKCRSQNKQLQMPLELLPDEVILRQIITWSRLQGYVFNRAFFRPTSEWIMLLAKPDFKLTKAGPDSDVWTFPPERGGSQRDYHHPAPFPVELPRRCIRYTDARTILDPFCGSGTTGVAALELGRRFVGIELSAGYIETAAKRLSAVSLAKAA